MRNILFIFFVVMNVQLIAQDGGLYNYDYIYKDNIKSVKFHVDGLMASIPLMSLDASASLVLSFDDLDGDVKTYSFAIVHCDINWQPSNLANLEYIEGFTEDRIEENDFSFKTVQHYTHYTLFLPSENMRWTKSGNYLLHVYDDEDERTPAITRRFMIVDHRVTVQPRILAPAMVSKMRTHQEIDFQVDYEKFPIRSPQQEVRAVVLQNGRWDNAITNLAPNFTRLSSIVFDYQDKVVFPAGKEFRPLDLRSLRSRPVNVETIEAYRDRFEVVLAKDQKRTLTPFISINDLNGRFVIETLDQNDFNLASNYANVLFSLYCPEPLYDEDVYIFGALSDWQLKPEFKMAYNQSINGYVGKVTLKQGYYDYAYAVVPRNPKKGEVVIPDMGEIEGNWHETSNEYTILVYYRPFGERYDQIIGAVTFNR